MRSIGSLVVAVILASILGLAYPPGASACVAGGGSNEAVKDPYAPLPPEAQPRIVVVGTAIAYYDALGWKIRVERLVRGRLEETFWLGTGVASCEGYREINGVHRYMKKGARLVFLTAQPWKPRSFDHRHQIMRGSFVYFLDDANRVDHAISGFKNTPAPQFRTLRQVIHGALTPDAAMPSPNLVSPIGTWLLALACMLALRSKFGGRATIGP